MKNTTLFQFAVQTAQSSPRGRSNPIDLIKLVVVATVQQVQDLPPGTGHSCDRTKKLGDKHIDIPRGTLRIHRDF